MLIPSIRSPGSFCDTALKKRRLVGVVILAVLLTLFVVFNRLPKLDTVQADLAVAMSPVAECFQGFCIEAEPESSLMSRWWDFSLAYLRLVSIGMIFAFLVAGTTEAFLFPKSGGWGLTGTGIKGSLKGLLIGPAMNLCSACIVPVASAFRRRGSGVETTLAITQGSSTLNLPAMIMAAMVFVPLIGGARIGLSLVGALLIGPVVAKLIREDRNIVESLIAEPADSGPDGIGWREALGDGLWDCLKITASHVLRLAPIMVIAGFGSGLAIQWISPQTVTTWLGDDVVGVLIATTLGIAINVPLLFEIPLVAVLLLTGMGTAPAAALLFTAAAGGPITFWGLAKVMPRKVIAAFGASTWVLGAAGGLAVLVFVALGSGPDFSFRADYNTAATFVPEDGLSQATKSPSLSSVKQSTEVIFSEVGKKAQVDFSHYRREADIITIGAGVVVFDYDGDGQQDIYVPNAIDEKNMCAGVSHYCDPRSNVLYRNEGDGTFSQQAEEAQVADAEGIGNGGCAADFDNDGHSDLFLTNWGLSRLFKNSGDGAFVDVTHDTGLGLPNNAYRSTGCAWGDYDRDGYVDLVVVRHMNEAPSLAKGVPLNAASLRPLSLYHNEGDGTFTSVTHLLGNDSAPNVSKFEANNLSTETAGNVWGAGFQPGWLDFNNDGYPDLYIVNDFGRFVQPNVLWRNDGEGNNGSWVFTDISQDSGTNASMFGMGLAVGDYNLDGHLDMFITNIGQPVLLTNNGDGLTFTDTTVASGAHIGDLKGFDCLLEDRRKGNPACSMKRVTWGTVFLDYDNDGDEDLYVASGFLDLDPTMNPKLQPNVLLRNDGDGTFTDVSEISGSDDPGYGHGTAYLDYNNDGCLDLYIANMGTSPKLPQNAKLFENRCDWGNSWLIIKTVGTLSNRDGIGTRVRIVTDGEKTQIREVYAGGSNKSQNMLPVHFGLGQAPVVDFIEIQWPSGVVQTLKNVGVNQIITVEETP